MVIYRSFTKRVNSQITLLKVTLLKPLYQKERIKRRASKTTNDNTRTTQTSHFISILNRHARSKCLNPKETNQSSRPKTNAQNQTKNRFRKHCRKLNSEESKLEKITSKRKNNKCNKIPSGSNPHAGQCALRSWLADHSASRAQVQRKLTQIYTAPPVAIL